MRKEKTPKETTATESVKGGEGPTLCFVPRHLVPLDILVHMSSSKRPHSKTRGGVANAWKILAISGSNFEMSFSAQAAIRDISISFLKKSVEDKSE